MNYEAQVKVKDGSGNIEKVFRAVEKDFMSGRASYTIDKAEDTVFNIQAKDATALRAMLEAIAKGLKIYEDAEDIK